MAPDAAPFQDVAGSEYADTVPQRARRGRIGRRLLLASLLVAIFTLVALLVNIANDAAGLVAVRFEREPATLANQPLETLGRDRLILILYENIPEGTFRRLHREKDFRRRSRAEVLALVQERVVGENIVESFSLLESLLERGAIEARVADRHPDAVLRWRSWVRTDFLLRPMSSDPAIAGVRTALLGSLWMIFLTMVVAVPVGIGAAIYLEEYAGDHLLNRVIQANINNLAGVPSIIYGMLGLAIFVRALEPLTSGALFGLDAGTGRTVLAASLTMALLILPIIIISSQEAIRAVPNSLRLASLGLGATSWQTVWSHVLPAALPGILTGTILAMSRAIGETAPLIVVGAATFIVSDPSGPFSRFTVLPIQIFNWTSRPQAEFRHIAAAAIVVLLILLLTLNASAVYLRNRFQQSL